MVDVIQQAPMRLTSLKVEGKQFYKCYIAGLQKLAV